MHPSTYLISTVLSICLAKRTWGDRPDRGEQLGGVSDQLVKDSVLPTDSRYYNHEDAMYECMHENRKMWYYHITNTNISNMCIRINSYSTNLKYSQLWTISQCPEDIVADLWS